MMDHHFTFFEIIVLFGLIEGFIIAVLIWIHKRKSNSKIFLSLILVTFNLLSAKMLLLSTGLWNSPHFKYFPRSFELLIQPFIWLYISSLVVVQFKFEKKYWLHFIPFFIFFGYSFFIYCYTFQVEALSNKDAIANTFYFNKIKKSEDVLAIISSVIYWVLGLVKVNRYRKWLFEQTSNTDFPTYSWLKNIAVLMGILIAILTIDTALDIFFNFKDHGLIHWKSFFIYIAGLIYYLGFKGYGIPDNSFGLEQLANHQKNTTEQLNTVGLSKINSKEILQMLIQ